MNVGATLRRLPVSPGRAVLPFATGLALALATLGVFLAASTATYEAVAAWTVPLATLAFAGATIYGLAGGTGAVRIGQAMVRRNLLTLVSYRFQLVAIVLYAAVTLSLFYLIGKPIVTLLFGPLAAVAFQGVENNLVVLLVLGFIAWPLFWRSWEVTAMGVRREQWSGTFESMVPTPNGVRALPFAYLFSSLGFSLFFQFVILGVFMMFLPDEAIHLDSPVVFLNFVSVLTITVLLMWGMGLLFGGLAILYKQIGPIDSVIKILFMSMSGIFIPLAVLPGWMQTVSKFLPLTYSLELLQGIALDGTPITEMPRSFLILSALGFGFIVAGNALYAHYVEKARSQGAIQGY